MTSMTEESVTLFPSSRASGRKDRRHERLGRSGQCRIVSFIERLPSDADGRSVRREIAPAVAAAPQVQPHAPAGTGTEALVGVRVQQFDGFLAGHQQGSAAKSSRGWLPRWMPGRVRWLQLTCSICGVFRRKSIVKPQARFVAGFFSDEVARQPRGGEIRQPRAGHRPIGWSPWVNAFNRIETAPTGRDSLFVVRRTISPPRISPHWGFCLPFNIFPGLAPWAIESRPLGAAP
jgi:hypothetical protein